jgi:hypothetical protein
MPMFMNAARLSAGVALLCSSCVTAPNWQRQMREGHIEAFAGGLPICVLSADDKLQRRDLEADVSIAVGATTDCEDVIGRHLEVTFVREMSPCVDCGPTAKMEGVYGELRLQDPDPSEPHAAMAFIAMPDRSDEELVRSFAAALRDSLRTASRRVKRQAPPNKRLQRTAAPLLLLYFHALGVAAAAEP